MTFLIWRVRKMGIDNKTRLEALEKLRNVAWEEFNNRRIYEWKMSMGIWTALAAFIALILTGRVEISFNFWHILIAALVIVIMVCIHFYFMHKLFESNSIARDKEFFFENVIMEILTIHYSSELRDRIGKRQAAKDKCFLDWAHWVQLAVTLVLATLAFIAVYLMDG